MDFYHTESIANFAVACPNVLFNIYDWRYQRKKIQYYIFFAALAYPILLIINMVYASRYYEENTNFALYLYL